MNDLQRRLVNHVLAIVESDPEDWRSLDDIHERGRLLTTWDWALTEPQYAVRFTLGVRRYCFLRGMLRDYLARGTRAAQTAGNAAKDDDQQRLAISLGQASGTLGDLEEAARWFQRVLDRPCQDHDFYGFAWHNLGQLREKVEDWVGAREFYEAALRDSDRDDANLEGRAATLANLASLDRRAGDTTAALRRLQTAQRLIDGHGLDDVEASILNRIGWIYDDLGRLGEAQDAYERALASWRRSGDRGGEASTLTNLALVRSALGFPEHAEKLLRDALEICEHVDDCDITTVLGNLGTVLVDLGRAEEAIAYQERVLNEYRAAGSEEDISTALNNLGLAKWLAGDHDGTAACYLEALRIWERTSNVHGIASTLLNLAVAEIDSGQLKSAMKRLQRAKRIQDRIGDSPGLGQTLNNIGLVLLQTAQPRRALTWFEQAIEVHNGTGERDELVTSVLNLAETWARLGDTRKSREVAETWQRRLGAVRASESRRFEALFASLP